MEVGFGGGWRLDAKDWGGFGVVGRGRGWKEGFGIVGVEDEVERVDLGRW